MASMATHAVGTALAIAALVGMVMVAEGETFKTISAIVFGGTLVLLYLSSTIYHAVSCPRRKPWLQALDHACIYLLIAGSYTPLSLVALRGPWGWSLFGVVWFLAIAGVLLKTLGRGKRTSWWSTGLYIFMGWLAVFALGPMIRALPVAGIAWLVAGGLCYTFGVIFFAWEKLRFNHAIWHLFVLAGSACHVAATALYILK
ncbi:hemolysin III family protein [Haloferula sp. BvORR071]|uniref:PAQR family membrane homeostasis protein TrhA n=1 Tax=Haloferula sp. BvORR071 TaxID=1396141 RepID=UPI0005597C90